MILDEILIIIALIIVAYFAIKIIVDYGGILVKIGLHLLFGWILLIIVNVLPGVNVPINLITLIISGFGGVLGTILLVILSFI